jgi:hypothetical protein
LPDNTAYDGRCRAAFDHYATVICSLALSSHVRVFGFTTSRFRFPPPGGARNWLRVPMKCAIFTPAHAKSAALFAVGRTPYR